VHDAIDLSQVDLIYKQDTIADIVELISGRGTNKTRDIEAAKAGDQALIELAKLSPLEAALAAGKTPPELPSRCSCGSTGTARAGASSSRTNPTTRPTSASQAPSSSRRHPHGSCPRCTTWRPAGCARGWSPACSESSLWSPGRTRTTRSTICQ